MLTFLEKRFLLDISREELETAVTRGSHIDIDIEEVPDNLVKNGASFVTLSKKGDLRGCIGKLHANCAIYKDVVENTYLAAFEDPRFDSIENTELKEINIEISILSEPSALKYSSLEDLLQILEKNKPGVVIKSNYKEATFLPQVWESIEAPKEFLSELCEKMGEDKDFWKTGKYSIETYSVENFHE